MTRPWWDDRDEPMGVPEPEPQGLTGQELEAYRSKLESGKSPNPERAAFLGGWNDGIDFALRILQPSERG